MKRRLKVLQVLPALDAGGVERGTVEFARQLVRLGHESLVLSSGGRLVTRLEQEGSRHFRLPIHRKHPAALLQLPALRRLLLQLAPDLVHLRSRMPAWLTLLAWRTLPKPRPRIVTTVHGFYSVSGYSSVMTRGEAVIAVSDSIRDYLRAGYPQLAEARIRVIPRGVNLDEFHPAVPARARPAQLPAHAKLLLLPGRLSRWKGQALFLSLLRRLLDRNPELPIAGVLIGAAAPGRHNYVNELHRLCNRLRLESKVFFAGQQDDMAAWYRLADLVFNLSSRPEPFGRTVIEALACGTPVVALDRAGPREVLRSAFPDGLTPVSEDENRQLELLAATSLRLLQKAPPPIRLPDCYTLPAQTRATLETYQSLLRAPPESKQEQP